MTDKPKLKIARGHLYCRIYAGLVKAPPGYMGRRELLRRARPRIEAELRRFKRERMARAQDAGFRPIGEAAKRVVDRLAG